MYSSQELKDKDNGLVDAVRQITKSGLKLKVVIASSKIFPKSNDFVLIDECDEVYFSYPDWFERTLASPTIIGFTATPPTQQDPLESQMLEKCFGDNIHDSKLALQLRDGEKEAARSDPIEIKYEAVVKMIKERSTPVLVYCSFAQV